MTTLSQLCSLQPIALDTLLFFSFLWGKPYCLVFENPIVRVPVFLHDYHEDCDVRNLFLLLFSPLIEPNTE